MVAMKASLAFLFATYSTSALAAEHRRGALRAIHHEDTPAVDIKPFIGAHQTGDKIWTHDANSTDWKAPSTTTPTTSPPLVLGKKISGGIPRVHNSGSSLWGRRRADQKPRAGDGQASNLLFDKTNYREEVRQSPNGKMDMSSKHANKALKAESGPIKVRNLNQDDPSATEWEVPSPDEQLWESKSANAKTWTSGPGFQIPKQTDASAAPARSHDHGKGLWDRNDCDSSNFPHPTTFRTELRRSTVTALPVLTPRQREVETASALQKLGAPLAQPTDTRSPDQDTDRVGAAIQSLWPSRIGIPAGPRLHKTAHNLRGRAGTSFSTVGSKSENHVRKSTIITE